MRKEAAQAGASPVDWDILELCYPTPEDLHPVCCAPGLPLAPNSKLNPEGYDKAPSAINGRGQVHGYTEWAQRKSTDKERARWQRDSRLGICFVTRTTRALDIDINDPATVQAIAAVVRRHIPSAPCRTRPNSSRCLFAFRVEGEIKKRSFEIASGERVEALLTGQQFVGVGTHKSGMRYQWDDKYPFFPEITLEKFEALWADLVTQFAVKESRTANTKDRKQKVSEAVSDDPVSVRLHERGMVRSVDGNGKHNIVCPFNDEHSGETSESATSYWPPHTGGYARGHFNCKHAHCDGRTDEEFRSAIGIEEASTAAADDFEDLTEADGDKPRSKLVRHISEVLAQPTQVDWMLDDTLERCVIALLTGPKGTFKSFVANHWGMSAALLGECVLFVSAEGAGLDRRINAWLNTHAPDIDAAALPVLAIERRIDFNSPEKIDAVLNEVRELGFRPSLIVLDTFSKLKGRLKENDNDEVPQFIQRLDAKIRTPLKCSVLLVCHTGHLEQHRARGAYSLEADTDAAYVVKRNGKDMFVSVSRDRFKDSPELEPLAYQAQSVDLGYVDKRGQPVTSLVMLTADLDSVPASGKRKKPHGAAQMAVFEVLTNSEPINGEGMPRDALIDAAVLLLPKPEGTDRRRQYARDALAALIDKGLVKLKEDRCTTA